MINKLVFFIKRYWVAECFSIAGTYSFAWIAELVFDSLVLTSYAGSAGAFLGFYLTIYFNQQKHYKKHNIGQGRKANGLILKDLLIEFGLSEVFDLFIIRPFCLFIAQLLIGDFLWSMIAGSILANIFFFLISGFMYTKKEIITSKINLIKYPDDYTRKSP